MLLYYRGDWYRFAFGVVACLMALYKHRTNIQRLRAGTEPKLNLFRKVDKPGDGAAAGPDSKPVAVVSQEVEKEPRANAPQ
jgi:hypothetical protein